MPAYIYIYIYIYIYAWLECRYKTCFSYWTIPRTGGSSAMQSRAPSPWLVLWYGMVSHWGPSIKNVRRDGGGGLVKWGHVRTGGGVEDLADVRKLVLFF